MRPAAYLGTPPAGAASAHHLDVWESYLRGLDPRHKEIITRDVVDYWCLRGNPEECLEKAHTMLDTGADVLSVFLSNPYSAERDIEDMSASILAHSRRPPLGDLARGKRRIPKRSAATPETRRVLYGSHQDDIRAVQVTLL